MKIHVTAVWIHVEFSSPVFILYFLLDVLQGILGDIAF